MITPSKPASVIDGRAHPSVKRIRLLRLRDERERTGLFYIEGLRFVSQAVEQRAPIEALVVCRPLLIHAFAQKLVRQQRRTGTPVLEVTPAVLHSISLVEDSQGIGAVVRQQWEPLARIRPGDELCWIAHQAVRSPGNLGTILRTSDAVGGAGVIALSDAIDPYDPAAVRATMGACLPSASCARALRVCSLEAALFVRVRWHIAHCCHRLPCDSLSRPDHPVHG